MAYPFSARASAAASTADPPGSPSPGRQAPSRFRDSASCLQPNAKFCILLGLTSAETAMKLWLPATALAATLTISVSLPADAHMGGMGGASPGAAAHASVGIHGHGFGFHHLRLFHPLHFHVTHFRFGGFRSHTVPVFTGGAGDFDYAADEEDYGPETGDDIDNLHFRVQEPFGPGDIGRPPVRAEEDAPYMSGRMAPWHS